MTSMNITHEAFSLRDGEYLTLSSETPETNDVWLAVMLKTVPPMPGTMKYKRDIPGMSDAKVESVAVIACHQRMHDGLFVWAQLSPQTKEIVGDFLFDSGASLDKWHYVVIQKTGARP